jgi:hypothetical protein
MPGSFDSRTSYPYYPKVDSKSGVAYNPGLFQVCVYGEHADLARKEQSWRSQASGERLKIYFAQNA